MPTDDMQPEGEKFRKAVLWLSEQPEPHKYPQIEARRSGSIFLRPSRSFSCGCFCVREHGQTTSDRLLGSAMRRGREPGAHGNGTVGALRLLKTRPNDRFIALLDQHLPSWRQHRAMLNATPLGHEEWDH